MKMICDNCKHDLCGPFEYTDGALSRVLFPGGYISNGVAYNYVTDWQGDVRQVVDGSTGEPVQETHLVYRVPT